jgi:hypothetical protein
MKITITQEDNIKAIQDVEVAGKGVCSHCPTAQAFSRATGMPLERISVGYDMINDTANSFTRLASFSRNSPLGTEIARWTTQRPRKPILGEFEVQPLVPLNIPAPVRDIQEGAISEMRAEVDRLSRKLAMAKCTLNAQRERLKYHKLTHYEIDGTLDYINGR